MSDSHHHLRTNKPTHRGELECGSGAGVIEAVLATFRALNSKISHGRVSKVPSDNIVSV